MRTSSAITKSVRKLGYSEWKLYTKDEWTPITPEALPFEKWKSASISEQWAPLVSAELTLVWAFGTYHYDLR